MNLDIKIIREKISKDELRSFLGKPFYDMIKFVVDVEREIIALGGEMHVDAEQVLLHDGSSQKNLWGANIYPDEREEERVEYVSLINIRPSQGSRLMEIRDDELKMKIKNIVKKLLPD